MKEILLISIFFLTLAGIIGLDVGTAIAQTNSVTVTNNMTGTDTNNATESEEESEAGMISRKKDWNS